MNKKSVTIKTLARMSLCCIALCVPVFISTFNAVRAVGGVRLWQISGRDELLKGDARNVSVTDAGALVLAPRFEQIADTEQPFVWSSARGKNGDIFLGTGHDGKVYRVDASGKSTLIFDAPELDVTALAVTDDGTLYAATSPEGKVYRLNGTSNTASQTANNAAANATGATSAAETFFDPPDKYIWSLAVLGDGSLAVGTGDAGKIYRVSAAANAARGSQPESALLYDADETHIISLATDRQGRLIAGTDPGGLVLQISLGGNESGAGNNTTARAFALFDATLREVHQLAVAPDGSIYALALSDAAATTQTSSVSTSSQAGVTATVVSTTIVEDAGGAGASGAAQASRNRNDLTNARSAVFRLTTDGGADVLWSSTSVTAFAIAFDQSRRSVLIGTGDKGRVYAVTEDGRDTLLAQASEGQISTLIQNGAEFFAVTSNAGKLFRLRAEQNAEGVYESPVHDASFAAQWGQISWRAGGETEMQTRTGNTASPDATWSEWSQPYRTGTGANITSPNARYVQWRAKLRARAVNGAAARVENVTVAYLPRNVAPDVLSVSALPPGVALQSNQQPIDPNIAAANLDPVVFGALTSQQNPPRRVFQRNAVSLIWQAEDRNADDLKYAIYYRAAGDASFRLLKDELTDNFYTIDGATLAEDEYVFKIVASDEPSNPPNRALTNDRLSQPVIIDNTPPTLQLTGNVQTVGSNVSAQFFAEDKTSRIRRVEWSFDGTSWTEVYPDDGVADARRESFTLVLPAAAFNQAGASILLRAFDQNGNVGSLRAR